MVSGPGRHLFAGQLRDVYANSDMFALPLSFPIIGVITVMADHFAPHGWSLFQVEGPFIAALGVFPVQASRRLVWEMGQRRRLWIPQAVTVGLVLVPAMEWGHVEDVLALACTLHSLRWLVRHNFVRAAIYLSVAIAFKQWAVMLVPLLVFVEAPGRRVYVLCCCLSLPALLAGFFLLVDFHDAFVAFFAQPTLVGVPGHPGITTWLGSHSSQMARITSTALSGAIAFVRRYRTKVAGELLLSAGLVLLLRPMAEPANFAYYWSPPLIVLVVGTMSVGARIRVSGAAFALLAIAWSLPTPNPSMSVLWWIGELLLLGLLVLQARRASSVLEGARRTARYSRLSPGLSNPATASTASR